MAAVATFKAKQKHICQLWNISSAQLHHRIKQLKAIIPNKSDNVLLDYLLKNDLDIDRCINYHFEQKSRSVNKSSSNSKSKSNSKSSSKKKRISSKKDLLKLSKRDLMKKCKKHKISSHGTKQEMVDRIIHSQRVKKMNNKTLQKMNGLSAFKATVVLIEGYIHIHTKIHLCPLDVITIIGQYVTVAMIRFDSIHKRYKKCIINGGTMFKRDTYFRKRKKNQAVTKDSVRSAFIIGCSIGYSFGVHKWKIKLIKPKPSDWIGIISNIGLFKKQYIDIFSDKGWSVAYMLLGGRYLRSVNSDNVGWNKKYKDHNDGYLPIWKKGDVVGVDLDCDNWRLSVSVNEQKIKTIWIKPYVTYYVAIGSVNNQSQYQLITFD